MDLHVKVLRDFRDRLLLTNAIGRVLVNFYYKYSPPVAEFIAKDDTLRGLVRWSLLPLVVISWVALNLGPVSTLVLIIFLCSCFIGLKRFRKQ